MTRALCVLALFFCGCHTATSVLVRVSAEGLMIPGDVASVRITADDPDDPAVGNLYQSAALPLCAGGAQSDCYALPISVVMKPGDKQPDATVRVTVTACDAAGGLVTGDAARFSFSDGTATTLDFVLSPRCLHTNCASQDRACGASGGCEGLIPSSGGADLAPSPTTGLPIARVYEKDDSVATSPLILQPPQNAQAGDLVMLFTSANASQPDWTVIDAGGWHLLLRRADAAEASAVATYTFNISGANKYILLVYRNVERYALGLLSGGAPPLVYPSFDVPVGGSYGIQLVSDPSCTLPDGTPLYLPNASLDEWGPLPAGPTGQRVIDCAQQGPGESTAQIFLIP
jgi:hypothetical protein